MNTYHEISKLWRWVLLATVLMLTLVSVAAAQSPADPAMYVTVCHVPPGHPEAAQTMQIAWSALDKCLSHFADYMGPCIQ